MTIITLLSSLPYLHEIITYRDGSIKDWIPNFGIQNYLSDSNGQFFNYSSFRFFLFTIFFNFFIFSSYLGWYLLKTNKLYRKAILMPLLSITYQIIIILSSTRLSWFNDPEVKIVGTAIFGLILAYFYFPKKNNLHLKKTVLIWVLLFVISLLPYLHDILTIRQGGELRNFIPILGIEQFLTQNNKVLGWDSYRIFIYIFNTHLFAQIGWACWFFDARNKLFRPFLLVPLIFNLYEITIISININAPAINKPDWKLYTTIIVAALMAVNLYFNSDKALEWMNKKQT